MKSKLPLVCAALALSLLAACGDKTATSTPATTPTATAPANTAPTAATPSSTDHPSEPAPGKNSEPITAAPAPGAGEGASAATDPSQKK